MSAFELLGNCEMELPDYMTLLQASEDEVKGPIIACGFHPKTKELVTLSSNGSLYELDVYKFFSTDDVAHNVYPLDCGRIIEFIYKNKIVTVDSQDILDASSEIQMVDLELDIKSKDQNINPTENDQESNK